jgi:AdoMet-dependent rRNA methyltransferase SPB1
MVRLSITHNSCLQKVAAAKGAIIDEPLRPEEVDDGDGSDEEDEDEGQRYLESVTKSLDEMYDEYVQRSASRVRAIKRGKKARRIEEDEVEKLRGDTERGLHELEGGEDEAAQVDDDSNPLLATLLPKARPASAQTTADRWFANLAKQSTLGAIEDSDDEDAPLAVPLAGAKADFLSGKMVPADADGDEHEEREKRKSKASFEEVAVSESDNSSDFSYDSDDSRDRAELMALGSVMLKKQKRKEDLVDDSFHRYTFNDTDLPSWFVHDENKHLKIQKPVTARQIAEMKEKLKLINARPIQKVAEAKARRKKRALKKLASATRQATKFVDDPDMSAKAKMKAIEKVMKQGNKKVKVNKSLVIGTKGGGRKKTEQKAGKGAAKTVVVDRRMKTDKRGLQKAARVAKGIKKKGKRGHGKKG